MATTDDLDDSGEIYDRMDEGKKAQTAASDTYKQDRKEERRRVSELRRHLKELDGVWYISTLLVEKLF